MSAALKWEQTVNLVLIKSMIILNCFAPKPRGRYNSVTDIEDVLLVEDKTRNDEALKGGSRIFSAYVFPEGLKQWIITEAVDDEGVCSHTTILLPEEY